ncbi:hypothetical protein INR49_001215, partial [Caranx melampygus]
DLDGLVFPLFPGTPLAPTSLLSLKQSQICSAVGLLELYCTKNYWFQPEYHLYSTPGQDGKQLLLYKVVIPSMQSTYIPDKLCTLLEDAKELAAQTALWNLDLSLLGGASCNSSSSDSPPLVVPSTSPGSSPVAAGPSSPPHRHYHHHHLLLLLLPLPHPRPSPSPPSPPSPLSPPLPPKHGGFTSAPRRLSSDDVTCCCRRRQDSAEEQEEEQEEEEQEEEEQSGQLKAGLHHQT